MKLITGDLFQVIEGDRTTPKFVLHQVNCQNVMGAGFALAFSRRYPKIKTAFHKVATKVESPKDRLGLIQFVPLEHNLIGVNSFSQLSYGRVGKFTDEDLLIKNIVKASERASEEGAVLYIPELVGCGLAGGDWEVVLKGISHLDNLVIVGMILT